MKKIAVVFCVVELFCAALVFGQNGVIKEISGTVELKRSGQTAFVPAKVGDEVGRNTIVSTGLKSSALIAIGSSVITARPLTRLSLEELSSSAGTETLNVSLQTGRVRVDVTPPAGTRTTMSVRGPSATASVRGTSFSFDTKNLSVTEGIVAFRGKKGGTLLIGAGSSSKVKPDDKAANPMETNAAELIPQSPIGTELSGHSHGGGSGTSSMDFNITLNFN